MAQPTSTTLVQLERITRSILVLRGQRVILDRELAAIYGVTTKRLNEQVKRNAGTDSSLSTIALSGPSSRRSVS